MWAALQYLVLLGCLIRLIVATGLIGLFFYFDFEPKVVSEVVGSTTLSDKFVDAMRSAAISIRDSQITASGPVREVSSKKYPGTRHCRRRCPFEVSSAVCFRWH